MKHLFFSLVLCLTWSLSARSHADFTSATFLMDDIEAYVKNACGPESATGAIDLRIRGGKADYTIVYSRPDGTEIYRTTFGPASDPDVEDLKDILPGYYIIDIYDAECAKASMEVLIGVNTPLSITATPPPICQEGTGEISPTVTGGTQPYTFAWSTGATTQNISGLSVGTFTLTVTDGNGCSGVESFEVESEFTGEISGIVYPACGNDDNGRITLTDVGTSTGAVFNVDWYKKLPPYFPFQYVHIKSVKNSWKNNSKNNLVNIPAGIYIVVITDHWGCQKSKAFELKQSDIDLDLLNTYDCQKSSTYNIKGIVNSNHDIVKYEWYYKSSKSSSWSLSEGTNNSDEITVPIPNSFPFRKLRVIDNDGLCSEKEAEISEVKVEIENPQYICTGDESITLIPKVVGGSNPYFFEWNTGETTESITVNQPGTYTISVTDRLNCNISKEIEVKPWTESGLTLDFKPFGNGVHSGTSRKPQDCKCDGRLQVFGNAIVDKLPYNIRSGSVEAMYFFTNQLEWKKLDSNEELKPSAIAPAVYDLCEGHYRVSTINTLCPIVKEIYLPTQPCSTRIELKEIKNTCSCLDNSCFGFIEIDVINPPNTLGNFKWFKDGVFFSDKQNLANLCTGTYKVEYYYSVQEAPLIAEFNIIDDCGDNIASEIDVLDIKNISECGRSDGMLHVGIKYDQSPVTYSWSNGATEAKITNLAEGDYTVTISSSCFIATKTFQICRCVDCISNFGDVQVTYPASCNGLYGSHNSNVSFLHYTSINASTASSNDGALIYDKTRNSINSNSIRFNWSGPNGFVSDKINLYNLFPGKYILKIFNGCKEEERTYYVTSSESCADLRLDLSLAGCTESGEPQVAVIIANIAGGSTNKEISFFTRKVDSPQFGMGINTINQVVRERVFDEGEVKVVLFDKETGCKVTKFITVKKLGKPLRLATVNANTFRGCEEYYGDNTTTFVRLNIIEGNGPYSLEWHDGLVETYHQQIFNNNESGALTLQRSFQLDRNIPLNWSATVTDACGNKATVDGIFSCNQGVDEDGNEIPCDMSGFNIGKWKGFGAGDPDGCFQRKNWNPFRYYAAIRAELTDLNKTFTVFWPDGTESHLGGKKHFDWEVPEKGLYSVRIQDGNGCFEIVQFDYTYECDTRSIFDFIGEGNPDNPNCPNISNIKVDGQSGSNFNVSFDLNNVSEDVSFKATFNLFTHSTNTIGASIFAGEVSLTKGKNVLTIPMSVMNQNKDADAFLAKIKLMDFLECPNTLDFVFEINGVSRCPDMQVFHNGNEGTVEIFSPSDINNCKLKITGLSDVTINLEKNKTFTHEFNTSSTGIVSIALELPSSSNCSRLSKQITINNDCDNNTLAIQQGLVTDILILDVYSSIPVIFDAKFNKSNGGSVNVPNSTNLNVSGSRRFEFDVKNLPIGGYKLELHYKNPNCPTKSINFTKESSCPYYIISDDYDPSSRKFVLTYTNRTNTVVNGKYEIRKDGKIVTEQNYILKTNVSGERFIIDGSNLNLEPGRYTVSWYTNPTLQCGGVRRFVFNISGLISEDPPESFKSCDDRIVNIMFDSYLNDYIIFWRPSNNDSLLLSYTHNSEVGLDGNKILNTFTKDTTKNIKSVLIDDDKNQYVINTDSSTINIKKLNVFSAKVWERTLSNQRYISETSKGNEFLDILVFDNIKQEYILLLIDRDGNIKEKTLDIPRQPYFIMRNVTNGIVTGRYDLGVLKMSLYDLSGNRKDLNLDKNIKPIDIKSINSESIAVGAEFKGDIEVNDKKYSSGEFNNTIYLNLNNDFKINKTIYKPKNINQFITSFDTDGLNSILVAGKSKVFYSAMEIDSCIYIEELFWEDDCSPFTSILEAAHCHLLWSPAPQGYSTTLQYFKDGVWMDEQRLMSAGNGIASLGSITSPYAIVRDGTYRLKHSHRDCPDVLSNEVVTSCHANCSCTPPILGYDAEDCWLEWNVSACSSYNVALERLDNNIWTTVMAHATSPFYLQTMGQYRLRLTQPGCSEITTSPVTTQCTPSQDTCICTAPSLLYNPAECTLSWSVSGCDGYTTQLQRWVSGVWVSLNVSSPYNIPALSNGNYRIHQSKDGCEDVVSATVNVTCSCTSPAQLTVFDDSDGFMSINPQISRGQTILHYVSSGAADACDRSHAQLAFLSSVVDDQWSIGGNGMGVLPYGVVGSYYLVDIYLPSDMTSGYGDIYMTHPCGDSYMLRIVYDCAPPCTSIDISVSGNTTNSCENITISPTNGVAPYTYDVSGTGNMGTGINYTGSNATINLSTLDDGEGITLTIVVTDANGCSGTMQQLYTRCANTCYGESCSTAPPGCNQGHIFSSSSGYNHDAIVYFTVPNGVTDVNIKMDPLTISQSLQVDKNGASSYINIASIRTQIDTSPPYDICTNGYHIDAYTNNGPIGTTGCVRNISNGRNFVSCPLSVNSGDILAIDINHPICAEASSWYLAIECNGSSSMQSDNNDEHRMSHEEGITDMMYFIEIESEKISSNVKSSTDESSIRFYPNPFSQGINLEMVSQTQETVTLQAINSLGAVVFEKKVDVLAGINVRYLEDFETVPSGVYAVRVLSSSGERIFRVIRLE